MSTSSDTSSLSSSAESLSSPEAASGKAPLPVLQTAPQSLPSLPARPNFAVDGASHRPSVLVEANIPASPGTPTSEASEAFLPNDGFEKLQAILDLSEKGPRDFAHLLPPLTLGGLGRNEQAEAELSPHSCPSTFLESPVATPVGVSDLAYMDTQVQEDALPQGDQGGDLAHEQDCLSHVNLGSTKSVWNPSC